MEVVVGLIGGPAPRPGSRPAGRARSRATAPSPRRGAARATRRRPASDRRRSRATATRWHRATPPPDALPPGRERGRVLDQAGGGELAGGGSSWRRCWSPASSASAVALAGPYSRRAPSNRDRSGWASTRRRRSRGMRRNRRGGDVMTCTMPLQRVYAKKLCELRDAENQGGRAVPPWFSALDAGGHGELVADVVAAGPASTCTTGSRRPNHRGSHRVPVPEQLHGRRHQHEPDDGGRPRRDSSRPASTPASSARSRRGFPRERSSSRGRTARRRSPACWPTS